MLGIGAVPDRGTLEMSLSRAEHPCQRYRESKGRAWGRYERRAKGSCSENRMVQPFTGKAQTGANILGFKIGMLGQNLFSS